MSQQRAPWLVGLTTLAAVVFARGPGEAPASARAAIVLPMAPGRAGTGARQAGGWASYLRVYEEFFAIPEESAPAGNQVRGNWGAQRVRLELAPAELRTKGQDHDAERLARIARKAKVGRYQLEFLVALVPDPADSRLAANFDLVVAGIEMGLGNSQYRYLFDRQWLPGVAESENDEASGTAARNPAGMMLFRGDPVPEAPEARRLMAVFLVAETPKIGIQKEAFRQAVDFISRMSQVVTDQERPPTPQPSRSSRSRKRSASGGCRRSGRHVHAGPPKPAEAPVPCPPVIKVLGPSSSGSALSLAIATRELPRCRFQVVSGSATAPNLKQLFPPTVSFSRTILSDDVLVPRALEALEKDLGWDLESAALLIEDGTAYASFFKDDWSGVMAKVRARIFLPSGVQAIRNAWEESEAEKRHAERASAGKLPAPGALRAGPEVSLADRVTALDQPGVSPLSPHIEDVALDNLLQRVTRYGYRYIGIIATDVKDEIFLAERVHRWAPDAIVFVFQSNLLYARAGSSSPMFGTLAISTFPLLARGSTPPGFAVTSPGPNPAAGTGARRPPTRQFASEGQQGIFNATRCLLGEVEQRPEPPSVWIAATGNTAMAPLARIDVKEKDLVDWCSLPEGRRSAPRPPTPVAATDRGNLPLLFFLILLCVMGSLVVRKPYLPQPASRPSPLLALAAMVLFGMAAGTLALAHLPRTQSKVVAVSQNPGVLEVLALGGTYLVVAYLLFWVLARATGLFAWVWAKIRGAAADPRLVGWPRGPLAAAAIVLGLCVLPYSRQRWMLGPWSHGAPGFLYLRGLGFSNGLSPFLPLAWLGGALFTWLFIEIKRNLLRERHAVPGPEDQADPAVAVSQADLAKIKQLFGRVVPRSRSFYFVVAAVVLATVVPFWGTTQPVAEPAGYGRLFLVLLVFVFLLCAMSFFRFVRAWMLLRRVLMRLEHSRCRRSFARISKAVEWNPMRAFVRYIPSFRGLAQPIEHLERRGGLPAGLAWLLPLLEDAKVQLQQAYGFEAEGRIAEEGQARRAVAAILRDLARIFDLFGYGRRAENLRAFLVVAYLRHVFGQLRYALMGAMVPALLALAALDSYAFIPKHYLWILFWVAVMAASAVSLAVFMQMDRDVVLSRIAGTEPGKVTLDPAFLSNIFAYAVLPVIALIASQVPQWGELVGRWVEPLKRVLETN